MEIPTDIGLTRREGPMTDGLARGFASPRTTPLTVALFIFCLLGINGGTASQSAAQSSPGGHFLWEFDAGG